MAVIKIFLKNKQVGSLRVSDSDLQSLHHLSELTVSSEEKAKPSIAGLPDGEYRCMFVVVGVVKHLAPSIEHWDGGPPEEELRPSHLDIGYELRLRPINDTDGDI